MKNKAKKTPLIFFAFGLCLFVIALLGDLTSLGNYENMKARDWEKFSLELTRKINNSDDFVLEAIERNPNFTKSSKQERAILLHNLVSEYFTSGHARHNLFSNWILYSLGQIHPAFLSIYDHNHLISRGHSLICSQHSYVLMKLSIQSGLTARHVGLNGHVVCEIFWDRKWHMFDPSMELFALDMTTDRIESVSGLEQNPSLAHTLYPKHRSNFADTFISSEDNSFNAHPLGVYFEWKSQVLMYFELFANYMQYIFPVVLVLFCGRFLFINRSV
jgi:hypothetical protein